VEAWHVGEQGGLAIAEVLFGDVNPAGRLPLSFPKHVGQLPVHYNRKPFGATKYVEMDWNPLYPFGYGLSYTRLPYLTWWFPPHPSGLAKRFRSPSASPIRVNGRVRKSPNCICTIPSAASSTIQGAGRVQADFPGTRGLCEVSFEVGEREMRTLNRAGEWVVEPGQFEVMVGPDSARVWLEGVFNVTVPGTVLAMHP
jgi:beta-glucosidase